MRRSSCVSRMASAIRARRSRRRREVTQRVEDFFARYLKEDDVPAPPPFETFSQACGGSTRQGPFTGPDWDAVRHGEMRFTDTKPRTFASTGGSATTAEAADDPLSGGPCRTLPAVDDPGAATYRFEAASGDGYTLLGSPTVIARNMLPRGSFAQVVARLWDVAPDGTQSARDARDLPAHHRRFRIPGVPAPPGRVALRRGPRAEARAARTEPAVRARRRRRLPRRR